MPALATFHPTSGPVSTWSSPFVGTAAIQVDGWLDPELHQVVAAEVDNLQGLATPALVVERSALDRNL